MARNAGDCRRRCRLTGALGPDRQLHESAFDGQNSRKRRQFGRNRRVSLADVVKSAGISHRLCQNAAAGCTNLRKRRENAGFSCQSRNSGAKCRRKSGNTVETARFAVETQGFVVGTPGGVAESTPFVVETPQAHGGSLLNRGGSDRFAWVQPGSAGGTRPSRLRCAGVVASAAESQRFIAVLRRSAAGELQFGARAFPVAWRSAHGVETSAPGMRLSFGNDVTPCGACLPASSCSSP